MGSKFKEEFARSPLEIIPKTQELGTLEYFNNEQYRQIIMTFTFSKNDFPMGIGWNYSEHQYKEMKPVTEDVDSLQHETPQQKRVRDAISKGMDAWEQKYAQEFKPGDQRRFISPKGYATDKLATTLVSIDPDGTAVVHPTYDKEGIMVKKLAAYGGMAGLRTRVAKREELSETKMSAQQKFNRSYEKMAGVWAPKKI